MTFDLHSKSAEKTKTLPRSIKSTVHTIREGNGWITHKKKHRGKRLYIGVLHRIFFVGVSCALTCYTELRTDFRSRMLYVGVLVKI